MKRFDYTLVLVVTLIITGCSCVGPAQELYSYWDGYDFSSLDGFDDIRVAEEKFDGYIDLLNKVPHDIAVESLTEFLDSASRNVVAYMVWAGWFEPYFHALQSPYRNDELFVAWLDKVLEDQIIDDGSMMEHLQHMRAMQDRNKVGDYPQDLVLRDDTGRELMLSEFTGRRTLLLFVDADCPSCLAALEENAKDYSRTDVNLVGVLVNGSKYHLDNIRMQLSDDVLKPWTFVCVSAARLDEALYDKTLLPFRMLISQEGLIEKSYY